MPANRLTTNANATTIERAKIAAGVNRLVALDSLSCDLLECIATKYGEDATREELGSMLGTLKILLSRIESAYRLAQQSERDSATAKANNL